MNRQQTAMVKKIMNATKGQYKHHQLLNTFTVASQALGKENDYQGLLDITNKMIELTGKTPAEKRAETIKAKKVAETLEANKIAKEKRLVEETEAYEYNAEFDGNLELYKELEDEDQDDDYDENVSDTSADLDADDLLEFLDK